MLADGGSMPIMLLFIYERRTDGEISVRPVSRVDRGGRADYGTKEKQTIPDRLSEQYFCPRLFFVGGLADKISECSGG